MRYTFPNCTDREEELIREVIEDDFFLPPVWQQFVHRRVNFSRRIRDPETFAFTEVFNVCGAAPGFTSGLFLEQSAFVRYNEDILDDSGPFGGERYFKETIAHEMGHVLVSSLGPDFRYSPPFFDGALLPFEEGNSHYGNVFYQDELLKLFGGSYAQLEDDQDKPWQERPLEGLCETIKDVFMRPGDRKFINRTRQRLKPEDFRRFVALIYDGLWAARKGGWESQFSGPFPSPDWWQFGGLCDNGNFFEQDCRPFETPGCMCPFDQDIVSTEQWLDLDFYGACTGSVHANAHYPLSPHTNFPAGSLPDNVMHLHEFFDWDERFSFSAINAPPRAAHTVVEARGRSNPCGIDDEPLDATEFTFTIGEGRANLLHGDTIMHALKERQDNGLYDYALLGAGLLIADVHGVDIPQYKVWNPGPTGSVEYQINNVPAQNRPDDPMPPWPYGGDLKLGIPGGGIRRSTHRILGTQETAVNIEGVLPG